jgi:hypothetical protein
MYIWKEHIMRITRLLIILLTMGILAGNCTNITSNVDTTPSDGSAVAPVEVTAFTFLPGHVDGVNSSYYVMYGGSTWVYWYLYNSTENADLYCYNGDTGFSGSPISSSTMIDSGSGSNDACAANSMGASQAFVEVRPVEGLSADYEIYGN